MAFTMSPMGKKKCSYSPMQEKGLISPMLETVKFKDSVTGAITLLTKDGKGGYTRNGNPVTPNENQTLYNPGTSKESNAQKLARLKKEKNG